MRRLNRRGSIMVAAALVGVTLGVPLGVIASHQFGDVPDTNTYHNDIDAIADVGVTTGCGNGNYCPSAFVTREQMAAFMNRLGALGPGKTPVVNATKLDGLDSTDFLAAGDIKVVQLGPWFQTNSTTVAIAHHTTGAVLTRDVGTAEVLLPLQAPGTIGGQAYGIKSVEICYGTGFDVTITATRVTELISPGSSAFVISDTTDRAIDADECYTVTNLTPALPYGASTLNLVLEWVDTSNASFGSITSTWTPVD
jgi:hypothetical protein